MDFLMKVEISGMVPCDNQKKFVILRAVYSTKKSKLP
jgi:hypothetical protein